MLIVIISIVLVIVVIVILYNMYMKNKGLDVDKMYKGLTGFTGSRHEKYNVTYGEITDKAMKSIVNHLDLNNIDKNIFIDLGCGIGKSLVYAINNGFNKSIGIELMKERYNIGNSVLKDIPNIEYYQGDLFEFDRLKELQDFQSVIFVSNLLFSEELNNKLFSYLAHIMKKGTIIIVSKIPIEQPNNIGLDGIITTPMTWSNYSKCYIFKIL